MWLTVCWIEDTVLNLRSQINTRSHIRLWKNNKSGLSNVDCIHCILEYQNAHVTFPVSDRKSVV